MSPSRRIMVIVRYAWDVCQPDRRAIAVSRPSRDRVQVCGRAQAQCLGIASRDRVRVCGRAQVQCLGIASQCLGKACAYGVWACWRTK